MVTEEEHRDRVGGVFSDVAASYDVMNDVMSLGIHRVWKNYFVEDIGDVREGFKVLDVAGGTGDIAFRIKDRFPKTEVTVFDASAEMLEEGKKRSKHSDLEWIEGNAQELPFEDNTFDLYTISFGIRNVTDRSKALREAHRVLKHGGRFLCMEFSKVNNPLLAAVYDVWNTNLLPIAGSYIAQNKEAYEYLAESIEKFPNQEEFAFLIKKAGFEIVSHKDMSAGIVAIHSGLKINKN